ncbi:MAG: argininosuccinate lyase [Vicinamibacterales bacterium]
MRFAPEYVTYVLNENFEDAKTNFLSPLMALHYAHLVMLAERGIVSRADAHAIREALDSVNEDEVRKVVYDGTYEDLFFYLDRLIISACGADVAGRLHTARSRNDIAMTTYRMRQRDRILDVLAATLELRRSLLALIGAHHDTVFAVHTHTQRAQPTTVAHYLLAVCEQVERDAIRLKGAFERTNFNPLGACAITGTGFDIDRNLTSELLGFCAPTLNTYGSIATADYLLESASACMVLVTGMGRFVQDLLLWSTSEFDYVRLGDGFVQGSSIMPQKRNPVALEHARVIGSKAVGQAQAVMTAVHNTPFGDINDTEDDLQPLVFSMFKDAVRAVSIVAAALRTAQFDAARLEARAGDGWTTLTELADTLVREQGIPFSAAHAISAKFVAARHADPAKPLAEILLEASTQVLPAPLTYTEEALERILSPRHFVMIRRTYGGPAPDETRRAAAVSIAHLQADEAWLASKRDGLSQAQRRLAERAAAL